MKIRRPGWLRWPQYITFIKLLMVLVAANLVFFLYIGDLSPVLPQIGWLLALFLLHRSERRNERYRVLSLSLQDRINNAIRLLTARLPPICPRHGGKWGEDSTCGYCTKEDGTPRALFNAGDLGAGAEG